MNEKPFTHNGITYPSMIAFCRAFGLSQSAVKRRLRCGFTDERLTAYRLYHGRVAIPGKRAD